MLCGPYTAISLPPTPSSSSSHASSLPPHTDIVDSHIAVAALIPLTSTPIYAYSLTTVHNHSPPQLLIHDSRRDDNLRIRWHKSRTRAEWNL